MTVLEKQPDLTIFPIVIGLKSSGYGDGIVSIIYFYSFRTFQFPIKYTGCDVPKS